MARKLTKAAVDRALRSEARGERFVFDSRLPGFGLRIRDGRGTYVFQYRIGGRSKRIKLDDVGASTPDEAFDLAQRANAAVRAGRDPALERKEERRRKLTTGGLLELYLDDLAERAEKGTRRGKRSTADEWRRLAERAILPELGRVEVERLDEARISTWHRRMAETPAEANRALTLLSAALGFGERRRLVNGSNPCRRVERFEEQPKQKRLSLAEVEKIGAAMREGEAEGWLPPSVSLALRLLLLCGLRRSEVLGHLASERRSEGGGLRWGDVDLDAGALRLRDAKSGARSVILGGPILEALRAARPADADVSAPVCPGIRPGAPFVGFEKLARRIFTAAGVHWKGTHAFRRTFASVAAEADYGEFIVGALLGHSKGSVTGRYVAPEADPLRAAADRICGTLSAALDGRPPAKVAAWRSRGPGRARR